MKVRLIRPNLEPTAILKDACWFIQVSVGGVNLQFLYGSQSERPELKGLANVILEFEEASNAKP